jgi:hypothetical protein
VCVGVAAFSSLRERMRPVLLDINHIIVYRSSKSFPTLGGQSSESASFPHTGAQLAAQLTRAFGATVTWDRPKGQTDIVGLWTIQHIVQKKRDGDTRLNYVCSSFYG